MRSTRGSGSRHAVIDVSVLVGASPRLVPTAAYGLSAATTELASHGVSAALVASRVGAGYRCEVGNAELLSIAGRVDGVQVYPVASLNPVQYLDWPAELERVLEAGALAIRFFPDVQGWTVQSEAFRQIGLAARGRCPMLVPVRRFGDASAIGAATADIDTPVVLVGGHYTQLGDCLAALERWPHLYLETSRLGQFRGVETVVRSVGARRMLFGSDAPARPIQAVLNAVLTANITDADKRDILAGNASRLFAVPLVPFELPVPTRATHLLDVHTHVGALGFPTPLVQPPELQTILAARGIDVAVTSSLRAIASDLCAGNAEAFQAVGDALRAYVVVNPNDLEGSCAAMDQAYARDAVIGAKLHCGWSGHATASRACVDLVREVARRGRPLKIHVDGPDWGDALSCVAAEHPKWKVIVAHGGPGTPSREGARLLAHARNVYVELPTSFPDLPVAREVVRAAGTDRLLFGSDAPLLDPAYVQGIYADAGADLTCTSDVAREVFDL
jgi:predicted TIM-barrel fold metal-dependent hydrolase